MLRFIKAYSIQCCNRMKAYVGSVLRHHMHTPDMEAILKRCSMVDKAREILIANAFLSLSKSSDKLIFI